MHGRPQKYFKEGQRRNFAYPFKLLTMQIDAHKRLTLSTISVGGNGIHKLLSEMFSVLWL